MGMSKYQEALNKLHTHCLASPSTMMGEEYGFGADYVHDHDGYENEIELLQELVDAKIEFESRVEKIVVGAQWQCVVDSLVIELGGMGYSRTLLAKEDVHCTIEDIDGDELVIKWNRTEWLIPKQQFLYCFKPTKGE